jgi:DNA-binding XRE family transcriptional regulator
MNPKIKSLHDLVQTMSHPVRRRYNKLVRQSNVTTQLACLRTATGLTQEQMGELLGMNRQQISQMEAGNDNDVTLRVLKAYSLLSGVPLQISIRPGTTKVARLIKQATRRFTIPAIKDEL